MFPPLIAHVDPLSADSIILIMELAQSSTLPFRKIKFQITFLFFNLRIVKNHFIQTFELFVHDQLENLWILNDRLLAMLHSNHLSWWFASYLDIRSRIWCHTSQCWNSATYKWNMRMCNEVLILQNCNTKFLQSLFLCMQRKHVWLHTKWTDLPLFRHQAMRQYW